MSNEPMFVIDANTPEELPNKYIQVDKEEDFIQDNLFVKEIIIDPEEKRYFQITVTNNKGQEGQTQRQYFPSIETANSKESYQKAVSIKQSLLIGLLRRYKGDDTPISANDWIDLITKIREMCKEDFEKIPLRMKFELDRNKGKYYTNVSTFGPFESMTVPRSETKHKITAKDRQMLRNKLNDDRALPDSDPGEKKEDDNAPF